MTTPPCSEGVTWIVFTNPVKVMSLSVSTSDKTSMRHTALQCTSSAMHNAALQRCETLGSELLGMQGQLHMLSMTDKSAALHIDLRLCQVLTKSLQMLCYVVDACLTSSCCVQISIAQVKSLYQSSAHISQPCAKGSVSASLPNVGCHEGLLNNHYALSE